MVRLLSERKMRVGGLLLEAGVPSEPMPESAALALIHEPREDLARKWLAHGILRLVPDEAPLTVRAVPDPRPASSVRSVESVAAAILHAEAGFESLSGEERARVEEIVAAAHRARFGSSGEDESSDPAEPPGADSSTPVDPAPGGAPDGPAPETPTASDSAQPPGADPWNLDGKDKAALRELARELGLTAKVDLRLGEERLREALRGAIAAEG